MIKRYEASPTGLRALRDRLTQAAKREGVVFGRLQQHIGVLVVTQLMASLVDGDGGPTLLVKGVSRWSSAVGSRNHEPRRIWML
ncbi:hypothetical protein SAMN04488693_1223 [Arthrobacter subterraneus]|uniref:Uncharacterized protein n=1 Tax=Arthrobacter subterraneus TaxID=335973 RepID=A0A1G8N545_9MICC|nr:hypothetical protein [Arthrobacter subterraneus]SDI75288.1 hypothetical protein SAMN04488693_1223 [Arthrobacter subterraneus]